MARYFLEISYHGGRYLGWQAQNDTDRTVQETLQRSVALVLRQPVAELVGSGRTDTGVHCKRQFAHFDTQVPIDNLPKFLYRLNSCLPHDIAVASVRPVRPDAHARFDALSRSYEYHITRVKNPLVQGLAYHYGFPSDMQAMNQAAAVLLAHQNFKALSRTKTNNKSFLCAIEYAYWEDQGEHWVFYIRANRFLRGMVRTIVGTLLEVGRGKWKPTDIERILHSEHRAQAGRAVPAEGLYLADVDYPPHIFEPPFTL